MRYPFGFICVLALGVMPMVGCGEVGRDAPVGAQEAEAICAEYVRGCPELASVSGCIETLTVPCGGHFAAYYQCVVDENWDCHNLGGKCVDLWADYYQCGGS